MKSLTTLIATSVTCALLSLAMPAAYAAEPATKTLVNSKLKGGLVSAHADKIYSREEIRAAKPLAMPSATFADTRYQQAGFREAALAPQGAKQAKAPGKPDLNADKDAMRDFPDDWRMLREMQQLDAASEQSSENALSGTADIYTGYRGNFFSQQHQAFPWKVVGKLLIDGGGYCTAQSITGAPKNLIVTAAHCVYDPGVGFKSGWTFVPAERNGVAPYGQYRWASATVLGAWTSGGGRRNDVALIRLNNNPTTGQPVSYYTGWLGWQMNYPYVRNLHSIGYASNISTQWTSMCSAESFYASCEGTDVTVKGCNMTYGSSGGAWIQNYKPHEVSGYVESVVSGPSCAGAFGQTFVGPHFSSANLGQLCTAMGGC